MLNNTSAKFARFILSITSGIGGLLFLFGFFSFIENREGILLIIGLLIAVVSEIAAIYFSRFEETDHLQRMKNDFVKIAGGAMAMPVLLAIAYVATHSISFLGLSFALGILSLINVTSLVIKVYLNDR